MKRLGTSKKLVKICTCITGNQNKIINKKCRALDIGKGEMIRRLLDRALETETELEGDLYD